MPLGSGMTLSEQEVIATEADRLYRHLNRIVVATSGDGGAKISGLILKFTTIVKNSRDQLTALVTRVKATELPIREIIVDDTVVDVDEYRRTVTLYVNFA